MSGFIETPRFPDDIAVWAQGGPMFSTTIAELFSGLEQRNVNWSMARARYDLANVMARADISGAYTNFPVYAANNIIAWIRAMKGKAYGFRLKDFHDFTATQDGTVAGSQGLLGTTGLASAAVQAYQSYKQYLIGTNQDLRKILKPVTATCTAYKNGVLLGTASLDTTTGIWTVPFPKQLAITGIVKLNPAEIDFGSTPPFIVGDQIYVSGVLGMTQINGGPYNVSAVGANSIRADVNATGFSNYTSGGTAFTHFTGTEVLTWAGQFDVPVRFDTDALVGGLAQDGTLYDIQSLPLIELLSTT